VLAGRAVEMGYDLRLVCRELSRVVRDLLVLNVDSSRASDSESAAEGERDRLIALAARFSREDLLRAFDLLTRAEVDIRGAAQPRYHLEMALLRWIHLRKLVPIEELIAGASGTSSTARSAPVKTILPKAPPPSPTGGAGSIGRPTGEASGSSRPSGAASGSSGTVSSDHATFKDAFLAEIRKTKAVFYNTVVAQAQRIDVAGDKVTFTFLPAQRTLREVFDQSRTWLESTAEKVAGRKLAVGAAQAEAPAVAQPVPAAPDPETTKKSLREQALADAGVQALLDVFPAEIRDIEELK
jgi:DNA polymerase III gamma/tau subunit